MIQSYIEKLGYQKLTNFCINGQQAIDMAKSVLDQTLSSCESDGIVKPVSLMLLDFQMPLKNGINVV